MEFFEAFEVLMMNDSLLEKILWSAVVILVVTLISKLIKNLLYRSIRESTKYYKVKRVLNYISGITIVFCILFLWFDSAENLTTYLGLVSAGIAIALKEIFVNMAGWFFIEFRRPFDVGHRITIGDQKGDVIDKRLFQFTLMEVSSQEQGEQSTGRIIDIPNSFIFTHPTTNYTKGFEYIWNEISILLTFESDWKKAKELLLEIANRDTDIIADKAGEQIKEASRKYMIYYNNLTPIVYTDIKESGVQLTIRYLCEPKKRRTTTDKIWSETLALLEEHKDIELAYPTKRILNDN